MLPSGRRIQIYLDGLNLNKICFFRVSENSFIYWMEASLLD